MTPYGSRQPSWSKREEEEGGAPSPSPLVPCTVHSRTVIGYPLLLGPSVPCHWFLGSGTLEVVCGRGDPTSDGPGPGPTTRDSSWSVVKEGSDGRGGTGSGGRHGTTRGRTWLRTGTTVPMSSSGGARTGWVRYREREGSRQGWVLTAGPGTVKLSVGRERGPETCVYFYRGYWSSNVVVLHP